MRVSVCVHRRVYPPVACLHADKYAALISRPLSAVHESTASSALRIQRLLCRRSIGCSIAIAAACCRLLQQDKSLQHTPFRVSSVQRPCARTHGCLQGVHIAEDVFLSHVSRRRSRCSALPVPTGQVLRRGFHTGTRACVASRSRANSALQCVV